jgi:AcrR family transcriptional regulator
MTSHSGQRAADVVAPPHIERPTREHVLKYARDLFVQGERIDMRTVADDLGIGRTTLYRWVGDRDQLLGEVIAELTRRTERIAAERARGEGVERALDILRRFMQVTATFEPLCQFARREPLVALHVLLAESGAVAATLRQLIRKTLDSNLPPESVPVHDELVDVIVQLGTALEWSPIVIGEQPAIDRSVHLMRSVINSAGTNSKTARKC